MDSSTSRIQLEKLLQQAQKITVRDSDDPHFKVWRDAVVRTLTRIYGPQSEQVSQFKRLRFFYSATVMIMGGDYSREHRQCFDQDLEVALGSIRSHIEELEYTEPRSTESPRVDRLNLIANRRVFVSHSSRDLELVEELTELLELIGLDQSNIFCTSFSGYGIDLGENWLDAIKEELQGTALVLFVISRSFFLSPICMCEMGATWVLSKEHVPIIVPPLEFSEVKGVIPLTQGLRLDDHKQLNQLKDKIEQTFGIPPNSDFSAWERRRDRIVARISKILNP